MRSTAGCICVLYFLFQTFRRITTYQKNAAELGDIPLNATVDYLSIDSYISTQEPVRRETRNSKRHVNHSVVSDEMFEMRVLICREELEV